MSGDVPRETMAPPAPEGVAAICGDALGVLEAYAELLARDGVDFGLIGPREVPRLWDRHLLNCAVVAPALDAGQSVIDLGSGAGLPGIVLAALRPDVTFTLLEPLARRVDFLISAVAQLDLPHVTVVRGRAEEVTKTLTADVVTSRAVAPLARLAGWALPLLQPHGALLAIKGQTAAAELAAAERDLRRAGAASWAVEQWGSGMVDVPTTVIRVVRGGGSAARRTPRRSAERRS